MENYERKIIKLLGCNQQNIIQTMKQMSTRETVAESFNNSMIRRGSDKTSEKDVQNSHKSNK